RSTGRVKSRRLRTARVVVRSASGVSVRYSDIQYCHIKHILAADVKHILASQQQYARGGRCALREVTWALDLGAMLNPTKGHQCDYVTLPIGLQNWNHRFAVNLSYKAYFTPYVTE